MSRPAAVLSEADVPACQGSVIVVTGRVLTPAEGESDGGANPVFALDLAVEAAVDRSIHLTGVEGGRDGCGHVVEPTLDMGPELLEPADGFETDHENGA